ncbi:MAG: reverse transcriptase family protein [Bryobacteraceae bacterium]
MSKRSLLDVLAKSFLAGEPSVEQVVARASRTLGRRWRWLRPLAQRYLAAVEGRTRPRHRDVVQFLIQDPGFQRASAKYFHELWVDQWLTEPQQMQPVAAALTWNVPAIESIGALDHWLSLNPNELEWFADLKGLGYRTTREQLRHYRYRVALKRSGNLRLIEAPKPRLIQLQQHILCGILDQIPPHPAAHGFLKGRSIKTFVAPHLGQRVVLRIDLQEFFPSIGAARVQAFFRTVGYPESVAIRLGGICTNATPPDVWKKEPGFDVDSRVVQECRALYSQRHLPQGAPTSPALANLCSYRMDCRLTGLAASAGATYTRYADDLAFSGDEGLELGVERFSTHVAVILLEEGFRVNHRKTRIMRRGVRQHLAGLVANQRLNVRRTDFDLLKATLHNCVRTGPESQNRDAHPRFSRISRAGWGSSK